MKVRNAVKYVLIIIILVLSFNMNIVQASNTKSNTGKNELSEEEIKEKEDKANKNLSYLRVEEYEIYPEFNKNTLNYDLIIPEDVTKVDVDTEPEMEGAVVRISGNTKLTKSDSTINIIVTAINGTSKTYKINVIKEPEVNLKLESLEIEGLNLNPVFNEDTFYYTSSIEDTELTDLNVIAKSNNESANIEIIGNKNIVDGENNINIILKSNDETTIYQVLVDVDKLGEKEKEADNVITRIRNIMKYATIGIASLIGLIILLIIITVIVKKVKKNKNEDYKEDFEVKDKKNRGKHRK